MLPKRRKNLKGGIVQQSLTCTARNSFKGMLLQCSQLSTQIGLTLYLPAYSFNIVLLIPNLTINILLSRDLLTQRSDANVVVWQRLKKLRTARPLDKATFRQCPYTVLHNERGCGGFIAFARARSQGSSEVGVPFSRCHVCLRNLFCCWYNCVLLLGA